MTFFKREVLSEGEEVSREVLYALWQTFYVTSDNLNYLDFDSPSLNVVGEEDGQWFMYAQISEKGGEIRFIWHPSQEVQLDLKGFLDFVSVKHDLGKIRWVINCEFFPFLKPSLEKEGFKRAQERRVLQFIAKQKFVRSREGWEFREEFKEKILSFFVYRNGIPKATISINTQTSCMPFQLDLEGDSSREEKIFMFSWAISHLRENGFLQPLTLEMEEEKNSFLEIDDWISLGFKELSKTEIWVKKEFN